MKEVVRQYLDNLSNRLTRLGVDIDPALSEQVKLVKQLTFGIGTPKEILYLLIKNENPCNMDLNTLGRYFENERNISD